MTLTRDEVVAAFAAQLGAETDATARKRMLSTVNLLAMEQAPKEAFEAPIRTLGKYLSDPIEVPPVLIHPYMCVRGGLNVTIGRSGKGKTVMNLNRFLRWAAGKPMFEGWKDAEGAHYMAPDMPLKILIVENEGAAGMFHRQIGIMLNAEDFMSHEDREMAKENIFIWGEGGYSGLKLDDGQKLAGLRAGIEQWKPDMVFIEPFRSLWSGEENSATEMSVVIDALIAIAADYNCGVWAAHHEKKGGHGEDDKMSAARGSTVLENFVTVMENFESVKGGEYRELSWSKSRHGSPPLPVRMEWVSDAWWYKWSPTSDMEEAIMLAVRDNGDEPMSVKGLCEELDEKDHNLRKVLKKLVDDGKLKKMASQSGPGGSTGNLYRLPSDDTPGFGGLKI